MTHNGCLVQCLLSMCATHVAHPQGFELKLSAQPCQAGPASGKLPAQLKGTTPRSLKLLLHDSRASSKACPGPSKHHQPEGGPSRVMQQTRRVHPKRLSVKPRPQNPESVDQALNWAGSASSCQHGASWPIASNPGVCCQLRLRIGCWQIIWLLSIVWPPYYTE